MFTSRFAVNTLVLFLSAACVFVTGCLPGLGGPTADFSADVTSDPAPLTVQFTDLSAPGNSPITQWAWIFGDGGTDNVQNPSHTYASAGHYNVSLAVTTANGTDTKLKPGFITGEGPLMVPVPAGTFVMGPTAAGDDATYAGLNELPAHSVSLSAYQIGRCEVTNKKYCDVLNWAKVQGYLYSDAGGTPWAGVGDIFAGGSGGSRYLIVSFSSPDCTIQYAGGMFSSKSITGLPGTTVYSMDMHPMVLVSWYGAAAFCNWLSQQEGLTQCYDMTTGEWPLTVAPPMPGGYRLPTEAEWERAAAWDGARHWIYGFTADSLTGDDRCNYYTGLNYVNPLGLAAAPYTAPDAWFDGVRVSPNGAIPTVNSVSPVGCYDMSGNVTEWCGDWNDLYSSGAQTDPTGPVSGTSRDVRGGSVSSIFYDCRTARRDLSIPVSTYYNIGFRIARS